jgi:pimeloyl-ACP methyl ester carboxylesterase
MKYVTVDDVAVLVHHRGPTTLPGTAPDLSAGTTVLCLHDSGGNGHAFAEVLDALAGAGYSPVAFDQPGHGRSGGLDSLGAIDAMAAHARAVADALGVEQPVLLGEGMGAAVALEIAMTEPGRAAALVLCGDVAAAYNESEAIERLGAIVAGRARREFDSTGYAPETPRDVYQRAFAEWVKTDPRATLGDVRALDAWEPGERLGTVSCPAVVVCGEHTEDAARAAATDLVERLSAPARLIVLPGAGRRGVLEQPAALAAIVAELVTGVADEGAAAATSEVGS